MTYTLEYTSSIDEIKCPYCSSLDSFDGYNCSDCWYRVWDENFSISSEWSEEVLDFWKEVKKDIENCIKTYSIGYLWEFVIAVWKFTPEEIRSSVEITNIEWLQWNFQRLYISMGSSRIKLDTNGIVIKNYARKVSTKNWRWKWYKWERDNPNDWVKEFLEEKLGAKFALS